MKQVTHNVIGLALCISALYSNAQPQATQNKINKAMNVLFVLTSHDALGNTGEKTGFWIEEFATPYYALTDQGVNVTIASPKGGQPPIDPKSNLPEYSTPATKRFNQDAETKKKLSQSIPLSKINEKDFDAIFYPGGHGPLWDLASDQNSIRLIETFYEHQKPVALVCHAPAALKNVKAKNGEPFVKGKKVTGFTNTEEAAVKLTDVVPFLVEDMLKNNGGIYSRGSDWSSYVIQDGLLITGQNPGSSEAVAEKLLIVLTGTEAK